MQARAFLTSVITVISFVPLIATATPSSLSLSQKIHNAETIISHAAKGQIDKDTLANIQQLLERAETALKNDDINTAEKLYTQAWDAYQAAVKGAQNPGHKTKEERDLAVITASVKALLKPLEIVDKENQGKKAAQIEKIKLLLAQSESAEDPIKARALANQAYQAIKIVLMDLRYGKTLTFDHNFATPALKYADEIAYNDMHFGLLDTALEQLRAQANAGYNTHVSSAKKLREQAEAEAKQNDYGSGIRDLMLSTKELKKALKHIGLSILPD